MLGLIGNRAEVRYLPQSLITDVPRMVAGLRVGQSFSAIPVSGQAVLMGAQAACLLIFVPDTVELAVSGPRSCCSLLERQRAAAGSLPRSSGVGGRSSTCPVAISITSLAAWLKSRGRFRWGRHGTVFACSGLSMQVALSRKNIQGGLALESRHKGAPGLGRAKGLSLF